MTTVNSVGNDLSGATGTGSFVGSISPTITTPVLSRINDSSGNQIFSFNPNASAVNYMAVANAPTGNAAVVGSSGSDTNIGVNIQPKGTGAVAFITAAPTIPFGILSGTSSNHLTNFVFADTAASRNVTFPDASGTLTLLGNTSTGSGSVVLATSPTITTPVIAQINDSNAHAIFTFTSLSASAVNYIGVTNVATGGTPTIGTAGSDSNISLNIAPAGTGQVGLVTTHATTPLNIFSGTAAQHQTSFAFANTSAARTVTFPDASGTVAFSADSTFTPVLNIGGATTGITYTTQTGTYSQVGNVVTFTLTIILSSKGALTGSVTITGLPATSRAGATYVASTIIPGFTYTGIPITYIPGGTSTISLQEYGATGIATNIANTNLSNTSLMIISGSYLV